MLGLMIHFEPVFDTIEWDFVLEIRNARGASAGIALCFEKWSRCTGNTVH